MVYVVVANSLCAAANDMAKVESDGSTTTTYSSAFTEPQGAYANEEAIYKRNTVLEEAMESNRRLMNLLETEQHVLQSLNATSNQKYEIYRYRYNG